MNLDLLKKNLEDKEYKVSIFKNREDAVKYLDSQIDGKTIGFGGSQTVSEIGLGDKLESHNTLYWHWKYPAEMRKEIMQKAQSADIYISSVNGISEKGEIVNIDGTCNRVSGTLYGHEKVYFMLGTNKIEDTLENAIARSKNVAAVLNCKRFGLDTPCVKEGKCVDCNHPKRICKGLVILLKKPTCCEYEVVIIDEKLGF